ncbi:MAG: hypothetical protein MPW17_07330 [Candidatus Manganitrophus sp.]|nr:hypothetical protein [Candidatus Manganitrophus sp.]WDT72639.1 MAG: hypothetical protein MPW17_07330 [Candidatus Manganitrophus sp.]
MIGPNFNLPESGRPDAVTLTETFNKGENDAPIDWVWMVHPGGLSFRQPCLVLGHGYHSSPSHDEKKTGSQIGQADDKKGDKTPCPPDGPASSTVRQKTGRSTHSVKRFERTGSPFLLFSNNADAHRRDDAPVSHA